MHITEWQRLALRTKADYDSPEEQLTCAVLGLVGESGELAEKVKKWRYQGHELDLDALEEEGGDVSWYLMLYIDALEQLGGTCGIMWLIQRNLNKLAKRYPDGFEVERSVNREE